MSALILVLFCLFLQQPSHISAKTTRCIQASRFYRDPDNSGDCSKYYLCLDGEVFEFQCSDGLVFDIERQICDVTSKVKNCAIAIVAKNNGDCEKGQSACADGMCIPARYFCDGSEDCGDGSDETGCEAKEDRYTVGFCEEGNCEIPDCLCSTSGKEIPSNLTVSETPQMILLTFEDEVNYDVLKQILTEKRKNPNGCPIRATLFVDHKNNNYQQIQKLWNEGHEIAVHSITHRSPETWWSQNATLEDWFDEMIGQANILNKFANVRAGDIRGMRAPFLEIGGNRQFLMMKEFGLVYDSSIKAPFSDVPFWPYTLDYKIPHKCETQNCPTRSYPQIWELVLNKLHGLGYILDAATPLRSEHEIFLLLLQNFQRHYYSNRAPFGLHIKTSWLSKGENSAALQKFVDTTLEKSDVWFVTNWQAIQWMQRLTTKVWTCKQDFQPHEAVCDIPNVCRLDGRTDFFYTCSECPQKYPWFRNEFGSLT